jgi:hypothetical protein
MPEEVYKSLAQRKDSTPIEQLQPIPHKTIAVGALEKQALTKTDPVLSYVDTLTKQRIISAYRVLLVDFRNKGKYTIMVQSFGATSSRLSTNSLLMPTNKVYYLFFVPLIAVRDSTNTALPVELASEGFIESEDSTFRAAYGIMSFQNTFRLSRTWRLEINEPGVHAILVYADNSDLYRVFKKGTFNTDPISLQISDVDIIGNTVRYWYLPSTDGKFLIRVARTGH